MKKTLSLLLILAAMLSMSVSLAFTAQAAIEDKDPLYYSITSNNSSVLEDRLNRAALSDEKATDGDVSLKVKAFGSPSNEIIYYSSAIENAASDTYTFSVDIYGNPNTVLGIVFRIEDVGGVVRKEEAKWFYGDSTITRVDNPDGNEGWFRYSWEVNCAPTNLTFTVFESTKEYYIDNLKLTNNTTGKNVLKNGSFEITSRENTIPAGTLPMNFNQGMSGNATAEIQKTVFSVVNDVSYTGENSLKINNVGVLPNHQYYLRPSVLPSSTGGKYTLSLKIKGNPRSSLGTLIEAFTSAGSATGNKDLKWHALGTDIGDGWYQYAWTFETANPVTVVDFAIYETSAEYYIDDFSLTKEGDTTNYIDNGGFEIIPKENTLKNGTIPYGYKMQYGGNAAATLDREPFTVVNNKFYSAGNSLKFNNIGVLPNEQYYLVPELEEGMTAGDYTFSFKLKGSPYGSLGSYFEVWQSGSTAYVRKDIKWYSGEKTALGNDWYQYDFKFNATTAPIKVDFNIYESTAEFWLDDLSLTLDSDTTGKNFIKNGNFDTNDETPPEEVKSISVVNKNASALITWSNPDSGWCTRIYDGEDLLAAVDMPETSVLVEGLENGTTYNLTIKTVNDYGYESAGVNVKVEPFLPDWEMTDVAMSDGKTSYVSGLTAFSTTVSNYKLDKVDAVLITALFKDEQLMLIDVSENVSLAKGEDAVLTTQLTIPDEIVGTKVVAYVWEDATSLKPIAKPVVFTPDPEYIPKTTLTQAEAEELLWGCSELVVDEEGYMDPQRFPAAQKAFFGNSSITEIRMAGLSFTTDAEMFMMDYKVSGIKIGDLDIFVDGELEYEINVASMGEGGTFKYALDGKEHRVDVYFPQKAFTFKNVAVTQGATIRPVENRTKALFYGSSSIQGDGIYKMSQNFVSRFARIMDYEFVNYGYSGYTFNPGQIHANSRFTPDVIFVAYGSNDANCPKEGFAEMYTERVTAFMNNLTSLYPTQKIYVITPTWTNWTDRAHNLDEARSILADIASGYENVTVVNGLDMMPNDASYFVDGIHPNGAGAQAYAENLAKVVNADK